jgi:hypothetical protein
MIKRYTYDCGESGRHLFSVGARWIKGMSSSGDHTENARIAALRATWHATEDQLRQFLRGYGAWEDLETADRDTLRERAIWIGGSDIDEEKDPVEAYEHVPGLPDIDA